MNNILYISLEQIAKISILLNPIIPIATTKVMNAMNINTDKRNLSFLDNKNVISDNIRINNIDILFKRIT